MTSMARNYDDQDDDDIPVQGRRKGMLPLTTFPHSVLAGQGCSTLPVKKSREYQSTRSVKKHSSINNIREMSVSTAMSRLRISEDDMVAQPTEHQAISRKQKPPSTPGSCQKASISTSLRNLRINSTESALVLFEGPKDSSVAPKTPSQIPLLSKSEAMLTPVTPSKLPKSHFSKPKFLSKTSNVTAFTEFDVEGRLENMETMYETLKTKVNESTREREEVEEARDQAKEALALTSARSKQVASWVEETLLMKWANSQ